MMGSVQSKSSVATIPVSCNRDCGGGCPLLAHVRDGRIVKITDNPLRGPYMSGCVRGYQMARSLYAPDRLTKPLIRSGPRGAGQWKEATWPQALDLVAQRLGEIKEKYGPQAIIQLGAGGAPRGALHHTGDLTARFLNLFGGCTRTTVGYSYTAAEYITPFVLGTPNAGTDPATLPFSKMIVLWGANLSDTRFGCELEACVLEAKKKGTPVVVIDPRRTRTVHRLGTQWIPIRPGTDIAMMMAVLYVLLQDGLVDREFVNTYSIGFDILERHVLGLDGGPAKTPQWAESLCGVPATEITAFAEQLGHTRPAALVPGLSIQRTMGGEEPIRMSIALQTALGNLGKLGGSSGALVWGRARLPRPRMGTIEVPDVGDVALVPRNPWPDAILQGTRGGYPSNIRAIYNVGGNYIVEGSDVHKSIRAFEKVDFSVCHDLFLTPTAQYCDVVLPVTHCLEREDIVLTSGNYVFFSQQAAEPLPEARNDYDIFCDLADRMGFGIKFSGGRNAEQWLRHFVQHSEVPDYEEFKRTGVYIGQDQMRVGLADFVVDPQAHPLQTPSGKIEIASEAFAATGFSPIPECRILQTTETCPLRLVTPKSRYRVHSQNHNIPWFREREAHRLWMHSADADRRGIRNGQQVYVTSAEGRVRIAARVTDDIMPGVVCIQEGVWPSVEADGTDTAGSANILTSTVSTEPSKGTRTHSVLVEVTPVRHTNPLS